MKSWKDERGAIQMVEGSILFPITFMVILLLVFFTFIFFTETHRGIRWQRIALVPTTDPAYAHPERRPVAHALSITPKLEQKGLFFRTLQERGESIEKRQTPFRFFKQKELDLHTKRSAVFSSSATNLWRYEAMNGFSQYLQKKK